MADANFKVLPYEANDPREIAYVVNNTVNGKLNSTGNVTLSASTTTTTVTDERAGKESVILFMPKTANASAEQGNGTIFISARANGSFTITHANNSQTDRQYGYIIIG